MEAFAYISSIALGAMVLFIVWVLWMGIGLFLILASMHNPTGGSAWIPFGGLAMMLSGLIALGLGIYWLVVQ